MNKRQKQNIIKHIELLNDHEEQLRYLGTNPIEFAEAIVGVTFSLNQPHIVYNYEKTLQVLRQQNSWTHTEAVEWFEYNIERSLGYYRNSPIFVEEVS